MTEPPRHLVAFHAELDAEIIHLEDLIRVARERLALAEQVLATYASPTTVHVEPPPPQRREVGQKPSGKRRPHQARTCPDCGQVFTHGPGLASHRRSKRPSSAAKPVPPIEPPAQLPTVTGPLVAEPISRTRFDPDATRARAAG